MSKDTNDAEAGQNERKERALMRTASHLSDLGTLTSLGASALYFAEQAILGERMPKIINKISLTAVSVGIGAVIASVVYRQKAGRLAHENEKLLEGQVAKLESQKNQR